jgi:hypothetical protein
MVCVGDTDILARDTDTYTKYFYTTTRPIYAAGYLLRKKK